MKTKLAIMAGVLLGVAIYAADEISATAVFNYQKGNVQINRTVSGKGTITGTAIASGVINIGTAYTALSFGSVTNAGQALLVNATTNDWAVITYGTVSNSYGFRIQAGDAALIDFNTNSWGAVALTNSCDLEYYILSR